MAAIIKVEDLSKTYVLNHRANTAYRSLREELICGVKGIFSRSQSQQARDSKELFWALKNVTFDVEQGERVAIIGRNGAGKSTLLKLLSRVTKPTHGQIQIQGRLSSLLEVGTGFHPELTGRENIYLNGAILGMKNVEVRRKFDEIVAFSEVEKFLDTPVKRYSSGMYVRLAFSVSAFLEPDITILDEVLSVGDAAFQLKCQAKMLDMAKHGRTVIFVSHSMSAVKSMCNKAIVLDAGRATEKLPINEAIALYLENNKKIYTKDFPALSEDVIIHDVAVSQHGVRSDSFDGDEPIEIEIIFKTLKRIENFRIGFFIKTNLGESLMRSLAADWEPAYSTIEAGDHVLTGRIPAHFLTSGNVIFELHSSQFGVCDYFGDKISFPINIRPSFKFNRQHPSEEAFGSVHLNSDWRIRQVSS